QIATKQSQAVATQGHRPSLVWRRFGTAPCWEAGASVPNGRDPGDQGGERSMKGGWKRTARMSAAVAVVAGLAVVVVTSGTGSIPAGSSTTDSPTRFHLGNRVQHVVNIVFDNVHFSRDNPTVLSDLEQMPHLPNFLESNGTVFSNVHTPMIAHTADD